MIMMTKRKMTSQTTAKTKISVTVVTNKKKKNCYHKFSPVVFLTCLDFSHYIPCIFYLYHSDKIKSRRGGEINCTMYGPNPEKQKYQFFLRKKQGST